MSKHTPGPWTIGDSFTKDGDKLQVEAFDSDGNRSLQILVRSGNVDKDMKLISSAPELLEALQDIYSDLIQDAIPSPESDWWNKARAAIAKATGEQP